MQITIGSAPDLLDRYAVTWSIPNQSKQYIFSSLGGIIQETVLLDDGVVVPDNINVDISVDFSAKSKIPGYSFSKQITKSPTNVFSYLFEVGQIIRTNVLVFDLPWDWVGSYSDDYIFVKWSYSEAGKQLYAGLFAITASEFSSFLSRSFCFLQDPGGQSLSGDISYEITGRLHSWPVVKYQSLMSLQEGEFVVLRPEFRSSPPSFVLKVVS